MGDKASPHARRRENLCRCPDNVLYLSCQVGDEMIVGASFLAGFIWGFITMLLYEISRKLYWFALCLVFLAFLVMPALNFTLLDAVTLMDWIVFFLGVFWGSLTAKFAMGKWR